MGIPNKEDPKRKQRQSRCFPAPEGTSEEFNSLNSLMRYIAHYASRYG
ncbi:hypothetical protein FHS02_005940 [Massilia umbonata]|uniref:Uncharacterized protein n=1 Tax=Pseudoduganella umbonata TaxID=864828 RepID=A0A7W5HDW1_9BURK|nr:hypothetical protein [Pseudoduganella umbonata]